MAFSQGNEEKYILQYFGNDPINKVYVELGAYDGITNSNTRALQLLGWSGVLIEPNPVPFKTLVKRRADDRTVCYDVAIVGSEQVKEVLFTVFDTIPQFSGLFPDSAKTIAETRALQKAHNPKQIKVKALTLDAVMLDFYDGGAGHIDFLSVDVEGTEQDALSGLTFDLWQPRLVCIENNDPRNANLDGFMQARGYRVATRIGINTFYERVSNG